MTLPRHKDKERRCKDCPPDAKRPRKADKPGPRCATHHRENTKRIRAARHEGHVQRVYGLGSGDYAKILEHQGGLCAICGPWSGRNGTISKRLAVDHDHQTQDVRGLLCGDCNRMLGHCRDRTEMLARAIAYLENPPAKAVLEQNYPPRLTCDPVAGVHLTPHRGCLLR